MFFYLPFFGSIFCIGFCFSWNFIGFSLFFDASGFFWLPWFILFYLLVKWEGSVRSRFLLWFDFLFKFWNYFDLDRDFDVFFFKSLNEETLIDFCWFGCFKSLFDFDAITWSFWWFISWWSLVYFLFLMMFL